jgi:hypothetical protein
MLFLGVSFMVFIVGSGVGTVALDHVLNAHESSVSAFSSLMIGAPILREKDDLVEKLMYARETLVMAERVGEFLKGYDFDIEPHQENEPVWRKREAGEGVNKLFGEGKHRQGKRNSCRRTQHGRG